MTGSYWRAGHGDTVTVNSPGLDSIVNHGPDPIGAKENIDKVDLLWNVADTGDSRHAQNAFSSCGRLLIDRNANIALQ